MDKKNKKRKMKRKEGRKLENERKIYWKNKSK